MKCTFEDGKQRPMEFLDFLQALDEMGVEELEDIQTFYTSNWKDRGSLCYFMSNFLMGRRFDMYHEFMGEDKNGWGFDLGDREFYSKGDNTVVEKK